MPTSFFDYIYLKEMRGHFPCLRCIAEHDKKIRIVSLVDSGSSVKTLVPYPIARDLGLISDDMEKTTGYGASGTFDAYETRLKAIHIIRFENEYFDTFNDLDVIVPTKGTYNLPFAILGRSTIFQRYDITFSERKMKIILDGPF